MRQLRTADAPARRRLLLAALAAGAAGGCASASAGDPPEPHADEVAGGVYMVRGAPGEVAAANLGRIGNSGFIVGERGVVAVDSGTSYRHGRALLRTIERSAGRPVRLLLLTHTRGEFVFGAAAFRERGIPIHMQRRAAQLMAARCETCLRALRRQLGDDAMRGTEVVKPDVLFDDAHVIDTIGRPVAVHYYGPSSGPGDIAVQDVSTRVVFAGGLLDWRRIPDVQDGQIADWQQALARLAALRPAALVPGHGALAAASAIEVQARYLTLLQQRAAELLRADTALSDVADRATLAEFADWEQADTIHRRNASVVFLRLEREQLLKP